MGDKVGEGKGKALGTELKLGLGTKLAPTLGAWGGDGVGVGLETELGP